MEIRLYCDRVEEGIAVLLGENDIIYTFPADKLSCIGKAEGNYFLCIVRSGEVISAKQTENTSAGENKNRLTTLFRKSENNQQW